jgi:RNA polymerase sigma-70 factor (ECF subfamily)
MIDRQEFERACMPSYGRVLQLCERMLGHRQQAEEVTQETFLRAFEKRSSFRGEAQVGTWLLSIAHRLCLDTGRRQQRQSPWDPKELPDLAQQRAEQARLLSHTLLSRLSERSRSLLILRAALELSYAEVASVLEIPVNQVGVYLQRARSEAAQVAREEGML